MCRNKWYLHQNHQKILLIGLMIDEYWLKMWWTNKHDKYTLDNGTIFLNTSRLWLRFSFHSSISSKEKGIVLQNICCVCLGEEIVSNFCVKTSKMCLNFSSIRQDFHAITLLQFARLFKCQNVCATSYGSNFD